MTCQFRIYSSICSILLHWYVVARTIDIASIYNLHKIKDTFVPLGHFITILKTALSKIIIFSSLPPPHMYLTKKNSLWLIRNRCTQGCLEGTSRYYYTANALLLAAAQESQTISWHMLIFVSLTNLSTD